MSPVSNLQLTFMKKKFIVNSSFVKFFFLISIASHSQEMADEYLLKDSFNCKLENLRKEFGVNKTIPGEIELECLAAISYYPELKGTKIVFKFGSPMSTMVSRPKLISIFRSGFEREYVIMIRKPGSSKNGLEWSELSFNSFVGWIAHELGHIVHYSHKTSGGVLFTGIKYAFPRYRRRMERFTDNLVIQHDLGYALLEGTDYCINHSNATPHYKNYMVKYYLSPIEIKGSISDKSFYKIAYNKTKLIRQDQISN